MSIERAAAHLRKVDAEHERKRAAAVEQLAIEIRSDLAKGVSAVAAARRAGTSRDTLYRMLRQHPASTQEER